MIGLTVLLVLIFYIWAGYETVKRLRTKKAKFIAAAVYALIPTWDVIPGKLYFNDLCENEAGLKIYKVAEGVEGYRAYPNASGLGREALEKYGYKYEERGSGSEFARFTLDANGKVIEQKITESIARYAADGKGWTPLSWNVFKYEVFIFDQQTHERLSVRTTFSAGGNWLQKLFHPYLGGHSECNELVYPEKDLYLRTLKPAKSTN